MAKRKNINVNGVLGGVFALAIIGAVGYIILRRDEILTGLDNRLNLSPAGVSGQTVTTTPLDTNSSEPIDNNDNDSSIPNNNNQNKTSTRSPRKASQYTLMSKIIEVQRQQPQQQQTVQPQNNAGYELARRTSRGLTQQQTVNQYYANKQGYDLASTFQSESKPLPRGNRGYTGAVPPALRHLFPKSISNQRGSRSNPAPAPRPAPKRSTTKRTLYPGLTGGHSGFRQAGG